MHMDERLQNTLKGATFVTLDYTLIKTDSMRVFRRRLIPTLLKRHAPLPALRALWWMAMGTMRLKNPLRVKWQLTKEARCNFTEEDWEATAGDIAAKLSPLVKAYTDSRLGRGCDVYIATAAPEEYALPLSRKLGYDGAIATPFTDDFDDYTEIKGQTKLEEIQKMMRERDLRLESFITDNTEDLPTAMEYPKYTILANPARKTAELFRHIGTTRYLASPEA